ncbi:J domain-containing protein [Archangium sp.]|uniref:J domain-containing protein n=1 Tax=Archangium sp. TaxID=1872627 RepID=UPI002D542EC5|nr:DnaJ domain-containing protein [Archangium sp.]HYO57648.1 DnaJ domain-containing protein [Archangium sp.]
MSQDPSSPHDKNPFEVLGLQGTEDLPAIRKAFLRLAAQSHPDRLRMKSQEEKAQALELFLSAKKAFEVLSQPDKRREWSDRMARPKSAPTPAPQTPSAPMTPPAEASSAPVASRPGPALTPAHGVPVASPSPPTPPSSAAPRAPSGMHPTAEPKPASRAGPLPAMVALQLYKMGMLALESSDYAKALDLFAKAAKVSPTPRHQAMELVCRGHQYLSTRFFDRARESFERALQLLPECREARAGLDQIDKQSSRYLKGR